MNKCLPVIFIASFVLAAVSQTASASAGKYVDHRGHNVDSLEIAVADWTASRIACAGDEDLFHLAGDWGELMNGYLNINPERSLYYGRKVLAMSLAKGWKIELWASAKVVGQYFWAKEQYDSAAFYYNIAINAARSLKVGDMDASHLKGLTQFDIDNGLGYMYGTIGNLYSAMDSIALAMEYYEMAGEIFERNEWDQALSCLHYNMAETLFEAGDMKSAKENYLAGLSFAEVAGDSLWVAANKAGCGRVELGQGHLRKAIRLLDEANSYYSAHDDQEWRGLLETLDYTNQVLRLQKRQSVIVEVVSIVALVLLIAGVLIMLYVRRLRLQKSQTDAVLDETIDELAHSPARQPIVLNDRERQILGLVAEGFSVKEIAGKVFLSPETIKWYRKKLLTKFDETSFIVVVDKARKMGLI